MIKSQRKASINYVCYCEPAFVKSSAVSSVCPRKDVISVDTESELLFFINSHSRHALSRILWMFLHVVLCLLYNL